MGTVVAFAVIVATSCIVGMHTVLSNYPPTILPLEDPKTVSLMMSDIFMRPYTHAGPFTIGIGTGYIIATNPFIRFRLVNTDPALTCILLGSAEPVFDKNATDSNLI